MKPPSFSPAFVNLIASADGEKVDDIFFGIEFVDDSIVADAKSIFRRPG